MRRTNTLTTGAGIGGKTKLTPSLLAKKKTRWICSNKQNPCPVCGRSKDQDCRTSVDRLQVICHHAKNHRRGEVLKGHDGRRWAFTGNTTDGRAGHFKIDMPREGHARKIDAITFCPPLTPAQPSPLEPPPLPPDPPSLARLPEPRPATGTPYSYSETQRVHRATQPEGGKRFYCEHLAGDQWSNGAGHDPWPMFNGADPLRTSGWPLEVEGEKCAELVSAAGYVGISQPGHAHSVAQIRERYEAFILEGVPGIVYLADHDNMGRSRAQQATEAAALAGLPLLVIHAGDLWPGLPEGGSIDDAPGTIADQISAIVAAARLAHEKATAQQPVQQHDDRHDDDAKPYTVLGWNAERTAVWYRHHGTAQIATVKPTGQAELLKLAPLVHWYDRHPRENSEGKVTGVKWDDAASALIEAANAAGVFQEDEMRGRGVWLDVGRIVWHLGDRLEVDGEQVALAEHRSRYHYRLMPALAIDTQAAPLSDEHGAKILQVLRDCSWDGGSDHLHLAGFCVLSNVGGALPKRPGLQITSPFGSGKTDTIDNVIMPLQGGAGLLSSGSTEAGVRQLLGDDTLPATIDESEAEDGKRREAQLRLVRYCFDGKPVVRGTPGGEAMSYCLRSSIALAGINSPIDNPADRSRIAVISRKRLPDAQWAAVAKRRAEVINTEIGQRLIRRTVSTLPALLTNITTFAKVISGRVDSGDAGRTGDTWGALLAGAHHLVCTAMLSEAEASAWLDSVGWDLSHTDADEQDRRAGAEGRQCLDHLLAHQVRWQQPFDPEAGRPSTGMLSVRELVAIARRQHFCAEKDEAQRALGRLGIRAMTEGLAVANKDPGIEPIFGNTKWAKDAHKARLQELEGAKRCDPMHFPSNTSRRAVVVPWSIVGDLGEAA